MAAENPTPVEDWDFDRLLSAVEQGSRADRHRIALALEADPQGAVADRLEAVLEAAKDTRRAGSYRRMLFSLSCAARRAAD